MTTDGSCWHCGTTLAAELYRREDRCPQCGKATHSCRNCRWYAPGRPQDCREPLADLVSRKEDPNFCDYFEPDPARPGGTGSDPDDLLRAAEDLFR
jgi:hypothetical protein